MTSAEQIRRLDAALDGFPVDYAFIGGGVLSLLVTDPTASAVRVTMDVDILANASTRIAYTKLDRPLQDRGFRHDMSEGTPVCRWTLDGIKVDILPLHRDVLGWESRWFPEALASARHVSIGERMVRVVAPPYFVALKMEAFESRGGGDLLCSHDFEDILCVFDGRPEIVAEIREAPDELRRELGCRLVKCLATPDLESAVEGFVQTEPNPESRMATIFDRLRAVASLADR